MYRENDLHHGTCRLQDNQSLKMLKKKNSPGAIPRLDQMHRACYFAGIIIALKVNFCETLSTL